MDGNGYTVDVFGKYQQILYLQLHKSSLRLLLGQVGFRNREYLYKILQADVPLIF